MADETSFTPKPSTVPDEQHRPIIHTYGDDMAHAMDATDAKVVAELLQTAREREASAKEVIHVRDERAWYTTGALLLLVLAIASAFYGYYHYRHLTVPAAPAYSVGVFPSIDPVIASNTDITTLVSSLETLQTLSLDTPTLVPITDESHALLSTEQFFESIHARVSEPFQHAIDIVRFGVLHSDTRISSFLIFYVRDPEIATKEFLIAEPTMLETFSPILGINPDDHQAEIGKGFESGYRSNLAVRTLSAADSTTGTRSLLLYYGYATDNTIVMATDPAVLKTVYDSIISQH